RTLGLRDRPLSPGGQVSRTKCAMTTSESRWTLVAPLSIRAPPPGRARAHCREATPAVAYWSSCLSGADRSAVELVGRVQSDEAGGAQPAVELHNDVLLNRGVLRFVIATADAIKAKSEALQGLRPARSLSQPGRRTHEDPPDGGIAGPGEHLEPARDLARPGVTL